MSSDIDFTKCGHVFNEDAVRYERARPEYPDVMVKVLLERTGLIPPASVLDIGTGTGKALYPFYSRGFTVLGIDPGENLLAIARAKLPNGQFELTKFEDWNSKGRIFDLIISGQAFHWAPPDISYRKAAEALRSGGSLALFWNMQPPPVDLIFNEFELVYERHIGQHDPMSKDLYETEIEKGRIEFDTSGHFQECEVLRFPWQRTLTAEEFFDLQNTYPNHITMEANLKCMIFEELGEIIVRHGGTVPQRYETVLYLARKRP